MFFSQRCEDEWLGMPSPIPVKRIYYLNLLKDVFGKAALVAQLLKNSPAMQETPVRFLGREDLQEKG